MPSGPAGVSRVATRNDPSCGRLAGAHRLGSLANRGDDVLVARAAAQVSRQQLANLVVGFQREFLDDLLGCHQHARRTEPALQAVMVPEGLLQRMQLVRGSQALDRTELGTVRLHGEHQTRADGAAVHLDRARPTDPVLASEVQAGVTEILCFWLMTPSPLTPWHAARLLSPPAWSTPRRDGAGSRPRRERRSTDPTLHRPSR